MKVSIVGLPKCLLLLGADNTHPPTAVKKTFGLLVNAPKDRRVVEESPHLISRTHTDTVHEWLMDFIGGYIITAKGVLDSWWFLAKESRSVNSTFQSYTSFGSQL
jgi:hypothetical protein